MTGKKAKRNVSVEDYYQFMGTRCGGFFSKDVYQYYTDLEVHASLKRNMMTDILRDNLEAPFNFKQAKLEMDTLLQRVYISMLFKYFRFLLKNIGQKRKY